MHIKTLQNFIKDVLTYNIKYKQGKYELPMLMNITIQQFYYLKQYTVMFKEHTTFLCLDDKSKVDSGEARMAISTGVRGQKSIVPCSSVLGALDHDVASKGSLTPSVCFHVNIPNDATESFYRGQVHVTLKNSISNLHYLVMPLHC